MSDENLAPIASLLTPVIDQDGREVYPGGIKDYPGNPAGTSAPPSPRKIPPIVLQEVVQWALNRKAPTDALEQEECLACLMWYLPEDTMYEEVRTRWGWSVRDVTAICDRPSFYVAMGKAMKPLLCKTYTNVMLVMSDRAEHGHLGAANFLFEETGMKREHRIQEAEKENLEAVVGKLIQAVQDILPKERLGLIGAAAPAGYVPAGVLPKAFDALPEPQRRERLRKTKCYRRGPRRG